MLKCLMVSLLFLLPTITPCMETDLFSPSLLFNAAYDSQRLLYLRKLECIRNLLKSELKLRYNSSLIMGRITTGMAFFWSVYNAKTKMDVVNALNAKGSFYMRFYHDDRIEDSSALGIVAIAHKAPFQDKKEFIQTLLNHHFTPTEKDKELATLEKSERSYVKIKWWYYAFRKETRKDRQKSKLKLPSAPLTRIFSLLINLEEPLF